MPNHPITPIPIHSGKLGLCGCPGGMGAFVGRPDPDAGVDALARWPATAVVSLMESREFEMLGLDHLPDAFREYFSVWLHLPIRDGDIPGRRWMECWQRARLIIAALLAEGGNVAIHCLAGVGRTGTVASLCLVDAGFGNGAKALAHIRNLHNVHAAETTEQEAFVEQYRPEFTLNKQNALHHLARAAARISAEPVVDLNGHLIRHRATQLIS